RAQALAGESVDYAERQGAHRHGQLGSLALAATDGHLDTAIQVTPDRLRATISVAAELVIGRLDKLNSEAYERVEAEATLRPERWRDGLRQAIGKRLERDPIRLAAAHLLDRVGDQSDIGLLRRVAKEGRGSIGDRQL